MMRLGRRTSLLVSLLFLGSAATAHSECAWLLWSTYRSNRTEHAIELAFETKRACEEAIPAEVQKHVRVWTKAYSAVKVEPDEPVVVAKGSRDSTRKNAADEMLIIRVSCWPLGLRPGAVHGAEYAH